MLRCCRKICSGPMADRPRGSGSHAGAEQPGSPATAAASPCRSTLAATHHDSR